MDRMTLTPELTEALCGFCGDVATMENNVDLIDCIEEHYIDEESEEPAKVLDTLKSQRASVSASTSVCRRKIWV